MECPKPSVVVSALIILVYVTAAAAEPAIALKLEPTGTSSHIPPILDCAPSPAAHSDDLSAFRGNVLALLGALPAAAAEAPTGFAVATAQSGGAIGDHRAFARAFCFGSLPGDCLECLSAAAEDVADGCHGRRGAVWRAGCFISYADTNAPTAREDAWRGWFYDDNYSDDTPTAALGSQCVAHATAAECSLCLNESAQVVPALREGRELSLLYRNAVVVVGYSCYLRVPLFPPATWWVKYAVFEVVVVIMVMEIVGLLFCIRIAHQFPSSRAFCFGSRWERSDCLNCLYTASQDVADGCHGRRGAVWRGGCFLSYADINASTDREDAFRGRGWFYEYYSDDTPTAALGSECVANTTAAEC